MAVSITVDEPDIDIAVTAYEGYSEVTGIRAPVQVGDAQSVKGDASNATGISSAVSLGDAQSTKGDASSADGVTAQTTVGDAESQKGDATQADGVSSQVTTGDAQSSKGAASAAQGLDVPVVLGEVQTQHLKPQYRWQMPLPPQLADDNETFDPATTAWSTTTGATYAGTVDNVGPNGETAAQIDFDGTADAGLVQALSLGSHSPFTQGFYVRAVSGTQDVMPSHTDGGTIEDGSIVTLSTDWQWIDPTITPSGTLDQIGIRSDVAGSIYLLRAGLNRGSTLEYSTRSEVPQSIPEVIQGANLSNGSTDSADTNDLDFGVDGDGVPYAVGDGGDYSESIDGKVNDLLNATYAIRLYVPSGASFAFGWNDGGNISLPKWDVGDRVTASVKDGDGTSHSVQTLTEPATDAWTVFLVTINNGNEIRLQFDGNTYSTDIPTLSSTPAQPVLEPYDAGVRQSHPEIHPVLTPTEAEAVRQRLASNPSDPVVPTEAWDTSVGSGDTLPAKRQTGNDITVGADVAWISPIGLEDLGGGSLPDEARHPTGSITRIHRVQSAQGPLMGRTSNGWVVTDTDLVFEDESGQTASSAHGLTLADDTPHTLAVVIDKEQSEARLYADASSTPAATVDLTQVGALKSGNVNLLPSGGTITHPVVFTRVLTGEEVAYGMQRLDDFPEDPFPEYVNP